MYNKQENILILNNCNHENMLFDKKTKFASSKYTNKAEEAAPR